MLIMPGNIRAYAEHTLNLTIDCAEENNRIRRISLMKILLLLLLYTAHCLRKIRFEQKREAISVELTIKTNKFLDRQSSSGQKCPPTMLSL